MRRSGALIVPTDVGTSDHACWAYTCDAERAASASAWLADGLELGQRALYVAEGAHPDLVADLAAVPDAAAAFAAGSLLVASSTDVYDLSTLIDPPSQLAVYAETVQQAIEDGYDGVRVVADITPLVADPDRRASHLRWEQYAERYIAEHPLAPLCLYDTRRITDVQAIVCAHPLQGPEASRFAVYGAAATRAAVEGELDGFDAGVLADVLAGLPVSDDVLDISRVSFVDGRSAWIIHDELTRRRSTGQPIVAVGATRSVRRVWAVCGFDPALLPA